ncbi:MAG: NUDIX domain-containing protein [Pseudomonadota bacterium]
MSKQSAGILAYRQKPGLEVFLVHPGGPYWTNRDLGAWSIPKGLVEDGESPFDAAFREFGEEVGITIPFDAHCLGTVRQKGGKIVHAWAVRTDFDASELNSSCFEMEWPPKSGTLQSFPEVDKGAWFAAAEGCRRIISPQAAFIRRLEQHVL